MDVIHEQSPVIISFPKSGRTWLRVMLDELGMRPDFHHAGSSESQGLRVQELVAGPREWRDRRVLFLMRDPRDTIVSAYFQATRRSRVYSGEFESFLRDPRFGVEKVAVFHLMWLGAAEHFPAFLALQYEAFHRDAGPSLARAAAFLGGEATPQRIAAALEAGSFARMRTLEQTGEGAARYGFRLTPGRADDPDSYKTRRGTVGAWREVFSPSDRDFSAQVLARWRYAEHLAEAGLTFEP
jgi:hypothetical protein